MENNQCLRCGAEVDVTMVFCANCSTPQNGNRAVEIEKVSLLQKLMMGFATLTLIAPVVLLILALILTGLAKQS